MSHLILEMSDVASWGATYHGSGCVIPVSRRPTILQPDRRIAEAEALRLASRYDGHFVVFAPVVLACLVEIPEHINLRGEVMQRSTRPALFDISADDLMPI